MDNFVLVYKQTDFLRCLVFGTNKGYNFCCFFWYNLLFEEKLYINEVGEMPLREYHIGGNKIDIACD